MSFTINNQHKNAKFVSSLLEQQSRSGSVVTRFEAEGGIFVVANRPLERGACVLECSASSVALDPNHRQSRCGFCCRNMVYVKENEGCGCSLVSLCQSCRVAKLWHEQEECRPLQILRECFQQMFGNDEVPSTHVLAIRLMIRRCSDQKANPQIASIERNKTNARPPLPAINWELFDMLHSMEPLGTDNDTISEALCKLFEEKLRKNAVATNRNGSQSGDDSWFSRQAFGHVLGRVIGCSHAITDVTLPLGCQCIGRALFLQQSFYNHTCAPNAFLSCLIGSSRDKDQQGECVPSHCGLISRVHCIQDVQEGEKVCLSYIPTSGIDCTERQRRLRESYHFDCACEACSDSQKENSEASLWERAVRIPEESDIESIREIQYRCNETLLQVQQSQGAGIDDRDTALTNCLSTMRMIGKGIANQGIPRSHEVSIERHRLLALALSLLEMDKEAVEEHERFFDSLMPITQLFDPVAGATQHVDCSKSFARRGNVTEQRRHLELGFQVACVCIGVDHPFTLSIKQTLDSLVLPMKKKRKLKG